MNEDELLNRIDAERYLAKLSPERRMVLLLTEGYGVPPDWTEGAVVTYQAIGAYIGKKFRGRPLSEAAIRYIREKSLEILNPALAASRPPKVRKNSGEKR